MSATQTKGNEMMTNAKQEAIHSDTMQTKTDRELLNTLHIAWTLFLNPNTNPTAIPALCVAFDDAKNELKNRGRADLITEINNSVLLRPSAS